MTELSSELSSKQVLLNLEPLHEHQILEVTYDGHEIYKSPETFAQNFSQILNQIDFGDGETSKVSSVNSDLKGEHTSISSPRKREFSQDEESGPATKPAKLSKSALSSVRSNIQNALTEVSVLFDVLQLAKDHKFLSSNLCSSNISWNGSSQSNQPSVPQHSSAFLAVAKRKSFIDSTSLLSSFANRLKHKQISQCKSDSEFYRQLIELRKFWKMRKTQHTLLGDLAVHNSASFHHSSIFEIVKRDGVLDVILPKDLENFHYEISASLLDKQDFDSLIAADVDEVVGDRMWENKSAVGENAVHDKLKEAHKSFINKELFSQMCKEATHMKLECHCCVVDDKIICYLSQTQTLVVSLIRTHKNSKLNIVKASSISCADRKTKYFEESLVLYIKQLYLHYMDKSCNPDIVHPVGVSNSAKQGYLNAAASGGRKADFDGLKKTSGVLESAIGYALHFNVRFKIYAFIEKLQKSYPSLKFVRKFQQNQKSINLKLESCLTLTVTAKKPQYAKCTKLINIILSGQNISFATNDSWSYGTSFACLENMLQECVNEMIVTIFLQCASSFTWKQVSFTGSSFSSSFGICVQHPDNLSKLSFSVVQSSVFKVRYWKPRKVPLVPEDRDVMQKLSLHQLLGEWKDVNYRRIPGKNTFEKFEHLFASFL